MSGEGQGGWRSSGFVCSGGDRVRGEGGVPPIHSFFSKDMAYGCSDLLLQIKMQHLWASS